MYILRWKNPSLNTNKATEIQVPVGAVVSNKSSLRFTGKGAPGYGAIQQENLMRLLENFADSVEPQFPTVGQEWFDTSNKTLKVCADTGARTIWKSLGGIQVMDSPPNPAALGDIWFQRTGPNSGVLYMYTGTGRFPTDNPNVNGGWNQIWPTVETVAGREEYDSLATMVNQLVGPATVGGANALGKNLPALSNFAALDADLVSKSTIVNGAQPKVDTIAADWDMLLATAKYAVNRLDLPAGMMDDISPVPFVSDGRPAPALLTTLPTTDIRYPSLDRRSIRRFGSVTLIRAFTETVNVLKAAVANRYALKGINGATGTNNAFASTTEVVNHVSFSGTPGGGTSEIVTLRFNFATAADLQSFLNSGGAIQATMSHVGTGTTDTSIRDLLNSRGVMRFTADKTRVFSNVVAPALAVQPVNVGLKGAPGAGYVLTSQTVAGATVTVSAANVTPTQLSVTISLNGGGGAINGVTTIAFQVIADNTTYSGATVTRVYGKPLAYAAGDKSGSAFLR